MKKVAILAMHNAMASTITGPMYVFYQAGVLWNYFQGKEITPFFETKVVSIDGRSFRCLNGSRMVPDGSIRDVGSTDLIVVSSTFNIEKARKYEGEAFEWLKEHHRRGAHIATVCTGAFVLAETGLLDGKTATTHWGSVSEFRRRYPRVRLVPELLITD